MSEQRLSDSGFERILWSSKIVATFFKIVAVIVLILGFIAGIINAYDVTHTTVDGQTYGVPGTGGQGFIAFLISFGLAFVSAGVFLFFAFVLELLSASAIRSSIVPLPPISNLQTEWRKSDSNNDGDKVNNQSLCPSCGSELTTGDDFCGDCGARVSEG
jgi:hypothetical protein